MDLTSLSGDDTDERVRRLCAKARQPLQHELVKRLGIEDLQIKVAAVCVYHRFVETAVRALEGSGIRVAAVSTGFPAGLSPVEERIAEIRRSVEAGADEIDIVITRALVFGSRWQELYDEVAATFGGALERLARAYEADEDLRRDLLQEIHVALWRSFEGFDGRCSVRTWIYRVAHNVGASHVLRQQRTRAQELVGLEDMENLVDAANGPEAADRSHALGRLLGLIQRLKPLDRHVILSYLEGLDAASIGEITGLSAGNVATKIHRIKNMLARQFQQGGSES